MCMAGGIHVWASLVKGSMNPEACSVDFVFGRCERLAVFRYEDQVAGFDEAEMHGVWIYQVISTWNSTTVVKTAQ